MSLLIALIVGGLVGWVAALVAGRDEGIFASILIGIVGAVVGGFLSTLFTGTSQSYLTLTWGGVFWSFIGGVIFVSILNALQYRPSNRI